MMNDRQRTTNHIPYSLLFRLLHWPLAISPVVMVLTGLSLHGSSSPQWSIFSGVLPRFFWSGQVHLVHLCTAVVFASALIGAACAYVRRRNDHRPIHWALLGSGLVMLVSAAGLLAPAGPPAVYWTARAVHAVTGLTVLPPILAWHTFHALTRYRRALWPTFDPCGGISWISLVSFAPVPLVVGCLILNGWPVAPPWRNLEVRRIDPVAQNTEDLSTLPWDEAKPLRLQLAGGLGFSGGRTEVTLRAMHDGRELFVLAQWNDPTEDRRYMPWKKTDDGWEHQVTNPDDESVYYEDKFSLTFPIESDWRFERFGCAAHCHLGGGRAYGYKGSDRPVDVWHWKATRTDPVDQVDDKYWSVVDFSGNDVGRHGDPAGGGGYSKNISDDKRHPKFLPAGPGAVKQGILRTEQAAAYTPEAAAALPAGTIVPGIVASPAVGDRGDVACQSSYESGRWQVYMRRKLDTGSPHDVRFAARSILPFDCAAFDHSSKRHAYRFAPCRMVLEE